jgi:hypothetical protein
VDWTFVGVSSKISVQHVPRNDVIGLLVQLEPRTNKAHCAFAPKSACLQPERDIVKLPGEMFGVAHSATPLQHARCGGVLCRNQRNVSTVVCSAAGRPRNYCGGCHASKAHGKAGGMSGSCSALSSTGKSRFRPDRQTRFSGNGAHHPRMTSLFPSGSRN